MRNKQIESHIALMISSWLRRQHKSVLYRYDIADLKLTKNQAIRMKRLQGGISKYPDLFICEPRGQYHGMYIELKKDSDEVYTKIGEIRQSEHIQGQYNMLIALRERGYYAEFGLGFEHTIKMIDGYLKIKG